MRSRIPVADKRARLKYSMCVTIVYVFVYKQYGNTWVWQQTIQKPLLASGAEATYITVAHVVMICPCTILLLSMIFTFLLGNTASLERSLSSAGGSTISSNPHQPGL